ncbi:MAG: MGMT family protein [Aulosira sp. ZfuVER01]|nr:MGMT family protein [Aulosira sp. ZfuVER01]MDZ7996642.1 MGMT family protein [Aulosira sp. DedVER01a]MDZ8053855.1 MGMT family protein [Aulosira sp. ZfuCHP01]
MLSENGSILNLFTKPKPGLKMRENTKINFKSSYGIEEDINANPISPRQVLIVRYEDIVELAIPPGELRENLVIQGIKAETFQPGSLITFETGAAVRLTFYCEPCKRINHLVKSLASIQGKRGILGVVIKSGEVQVGSHFQITPHQFPALSEKPYERFLEVLLKLPPGKVVTYKQILQIIGVDNSYMRAIPIYIKKASALDYPIHRILDSQGNLISHVPEQKNKLEAEDIQVLCKTELLTKHNKYSVNLKDYLWKDQAIYS